MNIDEQLERQLRKDEVLGKMHIVHSGTHTHIKHEKASKDPTYPHQQKNHTNPHTYER